MPPFGQSIKSAITHHPRPPPIPCPLSTNTHNTLPSPQLTHPPALLLPAARLVGTAPRPVPSLLASVRWEANANSATSTRRSPSPFRPARRCGGRRGRSAAILCSFAPCPWLLLLLLLQLPAAACLTESRRAGQPGVVVRAPVGGMVGMQCIRLCENGEGRSIEQASIACIDGPKEEGGPSSSIKRIPTTATHTQRRDTYSRATENRAAHGPCIPFFVFLLCVFVLFVSIGGPFGASVG